MKIISNKKEFWILLLILLVAAFCRLYKISEYMTFLGDEGRDVIIVRRIFTELHPPLIGPGTSIGSMYLGPLYYYLIAPALLIANFSPVGPAVEMALLGIITVWFVWWVGKEWFGKTTGLVAAALYAISPVVIYYSRSSWNPNMMPFFALLSMYSTWRIWKNHEYKWLLVLGISFAFVLQSHYLGLLLLPTIGIYWLMFMKSVWKDKILKTKAIRYTLFAIGIFLLLMSPLLLFDIRHNFINSRAIYKFFAIRQETVSIKPWNAIPKIPMLLNQINVSLMGKNMLAGKVASLATVLLLGWLGWWKIIKKKRIEFSDQIMFLISWLGFGLIGFGLYKQNIYDHYFGFIFAVPFLFIGVFISYLLKNKFLKVFGVLLLAYLVVINLIANPLRKEPNRLLQRSIDVSKVIEKESDNKPFNLAVIAETNYEAGYKYFLLRDGYPVIDIDSQRPETLTDQLFVVCELIPTTKCDPVHSPKAEVANYGWSKIDAQWEVDGVIIYKLLHTK